MTESLPLKEANLFRSIVNSYEKKQYTKALKNCETILKKYPQHGETISMKGLVLKSLDQSDEAYEHAKQGLRCAMKSHVCWHVYGLLYRQDRNYPKAVTCYQNALRHDPGNVQILRDMALLQIHIRNIPGLLATRYKLLKLRPGQRAHWIGYAIANHLAKNYDSAVKAIDAYFDSSEDDKSTKYEISEILAYKVMILMESENYEEALEFLNSQKVREEILDPVYVNEEKVNALIQLDRKEEAAEICEQLFKRNTNNFEYIRVFQSTKGLPSTTTENLSAEESSKLLEFYDSLLQEHSKSQAIRRLSLDVSSGDDFRRRLVQYAEPFLRKAKPSLYSDLKLLYQNPEKVTIIEEEFKRFASSLKETGTFPSSSSSPKEETEENNNNNNNNDNDSNNNKKESPQDALMWTQFFLAVHYDRLQQYDAALEHIAQALSLAEDKVPEFYHIKARIYKHMGDIQEAAEILDYGRQLDLADRYINSKCTKYLLRADQNKRAKDTIYLFLNSEGPHQNSLFDLQCMWFENENGESYYRQGDYANALRQFAFVRNHFEDIQDDQFDFHAYCLRKLTLRAYLDTLRFEDRVFGHKFFRRAAQGLIQCYVDIHDNPNLVSGMPQYDAELREKLSKTSKKQRLLMKDRKREEEIDGYALATVEDPLEEAFWDVKLLLEHAPGYVDTHILAAEVAIRKKKYLIALHSVKKGNQLDPDNPDIHRLTLHLLQVLSKPDAIPDGTHDTVRRVIQEEQSSLFNDNTKTLAQLNQEYLERHPSSFRHRASVGEVQATILESDSGGNRNGGLELMTSVDEKASLHDCRAVLRRLKRTGQDEKTIQSFIEKCQKLYPRAHF